MFSAMIWFSGAGHPERPMGLRSYAWVGGAPKA